MAFFLIRMKHHASECARSSDMPHGAVQCGAVQRRTAVARFDGGGGKVLLRKRSLPTLKYR